MAWMVRKSGRAYLYKKQRLGDKVRSIYVPVDQAQAVAQNDADRHAAVQAARHQAAHDRALVEATHQALHDAFAGTLHQLGYHVHRGELRQLRKRHTMQSQELIPAPTTESVSVLVQHTVLRLVEGVEPQVRDDLLGEFQRVRQEFGATATSPAERVLVEEISLAWLELYKLRLAHMQLPPVQAVFWSRIVDSAQLRFLRATELLARTQRRLAIPVDG